ncbi:uncharacterized protein [Eucyclogobius newberryi]|uniref:uncharacterized protein n=1 Tax=Eucyclogobius newberryi TaxID=166745 RepID=UPI003B59F00D
MRLHDVAVMLLVLCSGRPFTRATKVFEVTEGEDLKMKCLFYSSGHIKAFCKNRCESSGDILVLTFLDEQNKGRYRIEYEKRLSFPDVMYVSIHNVRSSDAGSYSCLQSSPTEETGYSVVDIIVYVIGVSGIPFLEGPSASESQQDHTPVSDVALYIGLTLSALVILSVTFTILYWKKRASTPTGSGVSEMQQCSLVSGGPN